MSQDEPEELWIQIGTPPEGNEIRSAIRKSLWSYQGSYLLDREVDGLIRYLQTEPRRGTTEQILQLAALIERTGCPLQVWIGNPEGVLL